MRKFGRTFPEITEEDIRACLAYAADRERRLMVVGRNGDAAVSIRTVRFAFFRSWLKMFPDSTPDPTGQLLSAAGTILPSGMYDDVNGF